MTEIICSARKRHNNDRRRESLLLLLLLLLLLFDFMKRNTKTEGEERNVRKKKVREKH